LIMRASARIFEIKSCLCFGVAFFQASEVYKSSIYESEGASSFYLAKFCLRGRIPLKHLPESSVARVAPFRGAVKLFASSYTPKLSAQHAAFSNNVSGVRRYHYHPTVTLKNGFKCCHPRQLLLRHAFPTRSV